MLSSFSLSPSTLVLFKRGRVLSHTDDVAELGPPSRWRRFQASSQSSIVPPPALISRRRHSLLQYLDGLKVSWILGLGGRGTGLEDRG